MNKTCDWYDVPCGIEFLIYELGQLFLMLFHTLMMGLVSLFESIPRPGFFDTLATIQLPPDFYYFSELFQLGPGVQIVMSAYTIRFLIRRLPFVG